MDTTGSTDSTTRVAQQHRGNAHRSVAAERIGPGSRVSRGHLSRIGSLGMVGALVLSMTLSVGSLVTVSVVGPAAGGATRATFLACSDTSAANHVKAPKTKFVIHAALAFGAFHHFIYKPYKAGEFQSGAHHRVLHMVAAAGAGLFVYHEVHKAIVAAESDPTLSHLVSPLTTLQNKIYDLGNKLKGRSATSQDFESTKTQLESVRTQAGAAGAPVQDCAA